MSYMFTKSVTPRDAGSSEPQYTHYLLFVHHH